VSCAIRHGSPAHLSRIVRRKNASLQRVKVPSAD
jgi:hypothetical protein